VPFVGDTTYDVGAAKAAGLPVVAVSFGFCDLPRANWARTPSSTISTS
jgi:phosphoglycolate phosphatase-like HAD superfamily hydrolase